jgi:uncharacterized integral membrane protein (TIGR00697 family)
MQEERNLATDALYTFHNFYRKKNGNYIVVAKEDGNPRGVFKIAATDLVTVKKDLLSKFSLEDKIHIIGLATTEKPPTVVIQTTEHFRYFSLLAMIFGCSLIASNVASSKLMTFFGVTLTGGTLPYLLTYVMGDIITEVYGYKRTRQLIWGAIACNLIAVFFITLAIKAPASPFWRHQKEYAFILGSIPRIITASMIGYFSGEFLNSYLIAKLKIFHSGHRLWFRIICASIVAMTVDNFLFLFVSYWHVLPFYEMVQFSSRSYLFGLVFEWLSIPLTTFIAKKLKSIERVDVFDINTNFTPFSLDVDYNKKSDHFDKT